MQIARRQSGRAQNARVSGTARSHITGKVSTIYWLAVTAIFLFYTFGPNGNGQAQYSWFIWAIGGVLYAAVMAAVSLIQKRK